MIGNARMSQKYPTSSSRKRSPLSSGKYSAIGLLAYCRPGFEAECAQELQNIASLQFVYGYSKIEKGSGVVFWRCSQGNALDVYKEIEVSRCIFARQVFCALHDLEIEDPTDRVSPVVEALRAGGAFGFLHIETPLEDEAGSLQKLAKKLTAPMSAALRNAGILSKAKSEELPQLHLVCLSGQHIIAGLAIYPNSSALPLGIPRLRFRNEAPSRSALKIEEAFLTMLTPAEREFVLKRGQRGVDLGAAPGGWTWYMVTQGVKMTAVDHGALQQELLEDPAVTYVSDDGYVYKPQKKVDWVVCDIVDKPKRTMERMADWLCYDWTTYALFNLKLPMKTRMDEVEACLQRLQERLLGADIESEVRVKQLYHDREEVTVLALTGHFLTAFQKH
ncbi:23S rRNA (cytidine(2498)-2'-O)-methyltransferase RlmM [Hahella sp. KA22]|nr:23S rRNA (cytidine(2498)-2'-O)-methyltransferase RlmM [Hahella sp. KA22]QAY54952.1 23S rRNA (cytidine(2498)-2'-O)-methyltransferase RlmM [Hahella sp. KA22]